MCSRPGTDIMSRDTSSPVTPVSNLLIFGRGNAKLSPTVGTFSLPAGHSCPGALECLCKADRDSGAITDGKNMKFRCYAASSECAFTSVRKGRWANFDALKKAATRTGMAKLIIASLAKIKGIRKVRIHVSGDFFSKAYFDAWMDTAIANPKLKFYAYTKALNFWEQRLLDPDESIPANVTLIASRGGRYDHIIDKYGLPHSVVVMHPEDAAVLNLEIDHDDSLAQQGTKKFALLLHGQQKKGTAASEALKRMRSENIEFAYS